MQALQYHLNEAKKEKESIHSGQFMVSDFEAEGQDDEDEVAVPIPEADVIDTVVPIEQFAEKPIRNKDNQQLGIDTSLAKLLECMSLAYRQKLTSPKWNRFRGIKLRWKDKIRLNNVIWRCWHLQFVKKANTPVCQFASPLDCDTHNKPEAVVLEGKYWKRKLEAVTAEYKKWRLFYRNHSSGHSVRDDTDKLSDVDLFMWNAQSTESMHMMVDQDYMGFMSDTLFSTIVNQPYVFPDPREIAKAGLADFIQPGLGPLQPNLDDYMDTFDPIQGFISSKLPTVPEEQTQDNLFKQNWSFPDLDLMQTSNFQQSTSNTSSVERFGSLPNIEKPENSMLIQPQQPHFITPSTDFQTNTVMKNDRKNVATSSKLDQIGFLNNYQGNEVTIQETPKFKVNERPAENFRFSSTPKSTLPTDIQQNQFKRFITRSFSKEEKDPIRNTIRAKPRSRSNTREPIKRPPLISAVSDPALLSHGNSVLLTQLLTTGNENRNFTRSQSRVKEENTPIPILPQPPPPPPPLPATLIITPMLGQVQPTLQDPLSINSFSTTSSNTIVDSTLQNLNSPTSSQSSIGSPQDGLSSQPRDQRRVGHIHAEQKRRSNIKTGFDMIHSLIPHLNQYSNTKLSKAAMLQKGAEYIKQLRMERNLLKEEMDSLRQQIENLNTSISNCQSMLPATGAPVSKRQDSKMLEMFDKHVKRRTRENWKYWIFSLLFRPLLISFNKFVNTSSLDELYRSTLIWVEQHCTLVNLRPAVLNSLKDLSGKTEILTEPEKLPEEIHRLVLANETR